MEQLRWFIQGVGNLLRGYLAFCGQLVQTLAQDFDLGMPLEIANLIGIAIGVLVLVALFRSIFKWGRKGNRPQAITLYTKDTPLDVVGKDLAGLVRLVIVAAAVGGVLAVLISRSTPLP
jgi:hypothetical protein